MDDLAYLKAREAMWEQAVRDKLRQRSREVWLVSQVRFDDKHFPEDAQRAMDERIKEMERCADALRQLGYRCEAQQFMDQGGGITKIFIRLVLDLPAGKDDRADELVETEVEEDGSPRRFAHRDDSAAAEDAGEECNVWYCVRGPPRIKFGKTPYYQSL